MSAPSDGQSVIETGHSDLIHDTCFDFYGKRVATCSSDRSVRIFDVQADGSRVQSGECTGHEGPVWQAAWAHPQFGTLLATCGYDARVMVFREAAPTTGASSNWVRVFVYEKNKSSVNSIAWGPHEFGLQLATASSDGSVHVLTHRDDNGWDDEALKGGCATGHTSVSWAPCVSTADELRIAAGGCDGKTYIWRKSGGGQWALEAALPPEGNVSAWVRDVAWCPAGVATLVGGAAESLVLATANSGENSGRVVFWRPVGGEWRVTAELPHFPVPVWRLSWSVTGRLLAVASADNNVTVWKEDLTGTTWQQMTSVLASS